MDNMELWNKYAQPPKEAMKSFSNGSFSGTDISPMWRIRCLTEEFGACGFGWYADIAEHWEKEVGGVPMVFVTVKLYLKRDGELSMPVTATGGNAFVRKAGGKPSDEAYKMAYTDALGGACKMLGIGGAVYWEQGYSKYEDSYTSAEVKQDYEPIKQYIMPTKQYIGEEEITPDTPQDTPEEVQYRLLALRKVKLAALDASCQRKFGTDFRHTTVEQLKKELPVEMLNKMEDIQK